ncbi:DUF3427 domain-containing protein [Salibacterium halotolerans]|nr:DUF3427 domain-containing protein [Salibacterium halotolerans]
MSVKHCQAAQTTMKDDKGKQLPVVHMNLQLKESIEDQLYRYLIEA